MKNDTLQPLIRVACMSLRSYIGKHISVTVNFKLFKLATLSDRNLTVSIQTKEGSSHYWNGDAGSVGQIPTPRRLQSCPKTLQTSFLLSDKLRSPHLFLQVQFLSSLIDCNSKQRITEMCLLNKLPQRKFYSTIMKSLQRIWHGKNGELTDLTLTVPWLGGWGQSTMTRKWSHAQAKTLTCKITQRNSSSNSRICAGL